METSLYVNGVKPQQSSLYSRINSIEKIVYDSSSVNRIIFSGGEIELKVSDTKLKISSKRYSDSGAEITHQIVKKLIPGYNPSTALANAKNSIIKRVAELYVERREMNINRAISIYFMKQEEEKIRQNQLKILSGDYFNRTVSLSEGKIAS